MTEIVAEQTIWYPGPDYAGRSGDYAKQVRDVPEDQVVELVQKRAKEDGEWAIENDCVGGRPEFMRKMMAWVSDEKNIRQCIEWICKEKIGVDITVDWVCRHLADATKGIAGGMTRE